MNANKGGNLPDCPELLHIVFGESEEFRAIASFHKAEYGYFRSLSRLSLLLSIT